jgi:hypothetical protein
MSQPLRASVAPASEGLSLAVGARTDGAHA